MTPRPFHRSECLQRCQRCSGARLRQWGSGADNRCLFQCGHLPKCVRKCSAELRGRCCRDSELQNLVLENYRIACLGRSTVGSLEPTRFQLSLTVIGEIELLVTTPLLCPH